jgi:hypothetical protein
MAQRDLHADPYLVSGRSAVQSGLWRMKQEALQRSVADADDLDRHARGVIRRCRRHELAAAAMITFATPMAAVLGMLAADAYDGSYEGAMTGNWSMLGLTVCLGVLMMAWGWWSSLRQLRETGMRLTRRAEYQRQLATLQLTEIEHATVR